MHRGSRRTLAALVAVLALLTGCGGIPTSGEVVPGDTVGVDLPAPYVARIPDGPVAGAKEVEVVLGFIDAMGSYQPGYSTAGLYLSAGARTRWAPQSGITVYDVDAEVEIRRLGPGSVQVALTRLARIDTDGAYQRSVPTREVIDLSLVREEGGEWRIDDPPAGVLMSAFDVERELAPFDVYFTAPDGQSLVAVPVFLPVRGAVPTLLVAALLRGVPRPMQPAVTTGFPAEAGLTGPGVPVEGGVAQVALTLGTAEVSQGQRDLMSAQLVWTLGQAESVTGVRLTLDGVPVSTGESAAGDVQPLSSWRQFDPAGGPEQVLAAVADGKVIGPTPGSFQPVAGVLGSGRPALRWAAQAPGSGRLAAVTADGHTLVAVAGPDAPLDRLLVGADLSQPGWDRSGRLWLVERGGARPGVLVVDPAGGGVLRVPVALASGAALTGSIDRVVVARDGVRVALLVRHDDGLRLFVGVLIGGGPDQDLSLRVLDEVSRVPGVLDVDWSGPAELAVLSNDGGTAQVTLVRVDASTEASRGPVADAQAVAASPGKGVVVSTGSGRLLQLDATQQWAQVGRGRFPSYGG